MKNFHLFCHQRRESVLNKLLLSDDEEERNDGWLATLCDISLLLLTFFILILSMSSLDTAKFDNSFNAIRDTFGGDQQKNISEKQTIKESEIADFLKLHEEMVAAQKNTFDAIRSFITEHALGDNIKATFDNGIITLRLPDDVLFAPGSEVLTPQGEEALSQLRDLFLKNREQSINIKGYTDNSSVTEGARFRNNWELSALRAVNVLRKLLQSGIEATRMTATGLGDLDPLAPNDTPENRAQNRRVEFILERKVGNSLK